MKKKAVFIISTLLVCSLNDALKVAGLEIKACLQLEVNISVQNLYSRILGICLGAAFNYMLVAFPMLIFVFS